MARSGKSTLAKYMSERFGFHRAAFASALKRSVAAMTSLPVMERRIGAGAQLPEKNQSTEGREYQPRGACIVEFTEMMKRYPFPIPLDPLSQRDTGTIEAKPQRIQPLPAGRSPLGSGCDRRSQVVGEAYRACTGIGDPRGNRDGRDKKITVTYARMLQIVGQGLKKCLGESFWSDLLFELEVDPILERGLSVVIEDVRFPVEIDAIKIRGGYVIGIVRPNDVDIDGRDGSEEKEIAMELRAHISQGGIGAIGAKPQWIRQTQGYDHEQSLAEDFGLRPKAILEEEDFGLRPKAILEEEEGAFEVYHGNHTRGTEQSSQPHSYRPNIPALDATIENDGSIDELETKCLSVLELIFPALFQ